MVVEDFISQGCIKSYVLDVCDYPKSSYYNKSNATGVKRGKPNSEFTFLKEGGMVNNDQVVDDIEWILGQEFVDYGYLKTTNV